MVITDLDKIKYYSEKNDNRNYKFRSFLKSVDKDVSEIDAIVHDILKDIVKQIDCTACANCCKKMGALVTKDDMHRISRGLKISEDELINKYLEFDKEENEYCINKKPCPFLQDNKCTIYEIRPEECQSFPHLHKDEFVFRMSGVISNCSVCPIVFNVYEELKRFDFRDDF